MSLERVGLPHGAWRRIALRTTCLSVFVLMIAEIGSCWAGYLVNGEVSMVDIAFALVFALGLAVPILIYLSISIEKLRHANNKLHELARLDGLTGALTRVAFAESVNASLLPAKDGELLDSLLVIDIDNFKSINDRYGHTEGDRALTLIARTIIQLIRPGDTFGRLGGEEFGVYMRETGTDDALRIAERLRVGIARIDFSPKGQPQSLTASIGLAPASHGQSFTQLYQRGDECLYRAKNKGRNRVEAPGTEARPSTATFAAA